MVLGNARGRSPYSGGRGYGRQSYLEDGGGRQMGGMGFGKRGSADYYSPEELQDSDYEYGDQEEEEVDEEDIPGTLRYLQLLEDYARILNQERGNEEKRGMASLARINSSIGSGTKRGMASLARINSNMGPEGKRSLSSVKAITPKRGLSSLRGGKRAMHSPLAALGNRRGKRGALSSLRSQGFTKYNI